MDTSATSSHMTHSLGTLLKYFPLKHLKNNVIVVGYGHMIRFKSLTLIIPSPTHPLLLKNVQHAPKLLENIISVHKFTHDNMVSVEFDPFGFSVKVLGTGNIL